MKLESSVTLFDDNKVEDRFAELQVTADGITAEVGRKVGNVCTVVIYALKDLDGNTEITIGTLPSGYRPYSDAVVAIIGVPSTSGFSRSVRITINPSGTITAYLYGSSMSGAINVRGTFTYSV